MPGRSLKLNVPMMSAVVGGVAGLLWSAVYGRDVSPAALITLNLAAGLVLGLALPRIHPRLGRPRALALVALVCLVLAPAALAPPYVAGVVWGPVGAAANAGGLLVSLAAAIAIALALEGPRRRQWVAMVAFAACLAAPVVLTWRFSPAHDTPLNWGVRLPAGMPPQPVAVVGIDGADWRVVEPLLDAGLMPNLASVISRGQHGILRSFEPMQSPVVWTSLFTGRRPADTGIVDWYSADARNLRAAPLWDVFAANGRAALAVNVPGTWPPQELAGGAVVSGFPLPGGNVTDAGRPGGAIVSTVAEAGRLPTIPAQRRADGGVAFELPAAPARADRRLSRPRHLLVEMALNHRGRRSGRGGAAIEAVRTREGLRLTGPGLAEEVTLSATGTPRWLTLRVDDAESIVLAAALASPATELRLVVSGPQQAPWAPIFTFATGLPARHFADRRAPYVVELPLLKGHEDQRIGVVTARAELDCEHRRTELVEAAVEVLRPQLVSYVITVTDRLQHVWPARRPGSLTDSETAAFALLGGHDPVTAAHMLADESLGRVLAAMPHETLVMVVSDHGFKGPHIDASAHRLEGIWAACGPMIPPSDLPQELSLLDVVPTLMRCLGLPLARDLAGSAASELCPAVPAVDLVASYSSGAPRTAAAHRLDRSRAEQLRNLGYLN